MIIQDLNAEVYKLAMVDSWHRKMIQLVAPTNWANDDLMHPSCWWISVLAKQVCQDPIYKYKYTHIYIYVYTHMFVWSARAGCLFPFWDAKLANWKTKQTTLITSSSPPARSLFFWEDTTACETNGSTVRIVLIWRTPSRVAQRVLGGDCLLNHISFQCRHVCLIKFRVEQSVFQVRPF